MEERAAAAAAAVGLAATRWRRACAEMERQAVVDERVRRRYDRWELLTGALERTAPKALNCEMAVESCFHVFIRRCLKTLNFVEGKNEAHILQLLSTGRPFISGLKDWWAAPGPLCGLRCAPRRVENELVRR